MQAGSGALSGDAGNASAHSVWAQAPYQVDTYGAKPGAVPDSAQAAGPPFGVGAEGLQAWAAARSSIYNASELRVTLATTVTAGSDWADFHRSVPM